MEGNWIHMVTHINQRATKAGISFCKYMQVKEFCFLFPFCNVNKKYKTDAEGFRQCSSMLY